jgi:type 1 glutamine amidotransferase
MRSFVFPLLAASAFLAQPARAQTQFNVLVVAVPEKWHRDCIPVAKESFEKMALHHQFGLTWSTDPAAFDGDLKKFAVIVFLNTPSEELNEARRRRFQDYIHAGGSFVGVHMGIATKREWPWYEQLVGRSFRIHPYVQTAVLHITDRAFSATMPLPDRWIWTDEWYEFDAPLVPDLHVVMTVDESTYDPTKIWEGQKAAGMGAFHPIAWYHVFEGGRSFVTALGHMPELYRDKTFLDHLYGGIYWAATGRAIAAAK